MKFKLPEIEEKILKFWKDHNIFQKTLDKTKKKEKFIFYEGPPTANGKPGIHHLLTRAFKDIISRYKTMQGFYVERKAGWDTHGLPVEIEVEKNLDTKTKADIEKYGIEKFNKKCKSSVWKYKEEWERFTERIGFWLDMDNPYITYEDYYVETVWWIIKQIWEKGLLYQDYRVSPYCPRCGTSLSSHEVAQGYKKIEEESIFVKFKAKDEDNTYFLCWTTTPWTLPGNVAITVNPGIEYVKAKANGENLILAKEKLEVLEEDYQIVKQFKGKELVGRKYEGLFPESQLEESENIYEVIPGDFVSLEEGTGLVHTAPAFGEEDMIAVQERNKETDKELPVLIPVDEEGKFKKEIKKWHGKFVKKADPEIIENLKERGLLYKSEMYTHDYPFCWRCKTPLIYYALETWFVNVSKKRDQLIENNKKINWVPGHIKKGRFGEWLREVKDWNLSRERYWGTPLPVWQCKKCSEIKVIGSIKELADVSNQKVSEIHRPSIDKIKFKCEKCDAEMERVPEVIDCWFDSGSMPFAQRHYPFENKDEIDNNILFPADYISEAIDQTRGWFYTLLAISTLLEKGIPYKNVICLGLVMDSDGKKMSKSKGNIVKPKNVVEKFGADCARFYFYTINNPGEPKRFDMDEVRDLYRKFFDTLWNSYKFFSIYIDDEFKPNKEFDSDNVLDQWIISKLEKLNQQVEDDLNNFYVVKAARKIKDFVDDLSNWYIRCSRRRFQKPSSKKEKEQAAQTLYRVLLKFVVIISPFTPFISEEIYHKLKGREESVHLEEFPTPKKQFVNTKLESQMDQARKIIAEVLSVRSEKGIKVRQPLSKLEIPDSKGVGEATVGVGEATVLKNNQQIVDLIKARLNVEKIIFGSKIKLNTEITPALKRKGIAREVVRQIQSMRKKAGYKPHDKISVSYSGTDYITDTLAQHKDFILKEIKAEDFRVRERGNHAPGDKQDSHFDIERETEIKKEKIWIGIKTV